MSRGTYGNGRLAGQPPTPTFRREAAPREGYTREFVDDRLARQAEEEQARARNAAENEALRRQREETLDAERKAKRDEAEKSFEAEIAAVHKERLQREWLANHPGETATAFEVEAWPHLLANLKAEAIREAHEAYTRRLRAQDYESDGDLIPVNWSMDQRRSRALDRL
ncbi:MAG TPA: hypothetical protein VFV58_30895 [Blastocatellia bacterium]|jgi:hypothetical protein|nr:hypothetical protein [Blastocatellia bacterium]